MYKPLHLCVIDDNELMKNVSQPSFPMSEKSPVYCRDFELTSDIAADEDEEVDDYNDDEVVDDADDHIDADYVTDIFFWVFHFILICYSLLLFLVNFC